MVNEVEDKEIQLDQDTSVKKLTEWKQEPTLAELKADLEEAKPSHDAQVTKVETWLDNLHVRGKAKPKQDGTRSGVQPALIRKQAEWRYPALSEPFLSTDDLFKVSPRTWADRKAAQQNALVLNYQFTTKIDRVGFFDEYIRTSVDEGTAIVRTGWEYEEEEVITQVPTFDFVVDPAYGPQLEQIDALYQSNPAGFDELPEEQRQAYELALQHGQPIRPEPTGFQDVTEIMVTKNHPTLEVCDLRNVTIDPTCNGDIDKASFVIYSFESSLSELRKKGIYQNLDQINISASSILGEPDHDATEEATKSFNFSDEPRKKIVVFEYWGFRDIDGSGVVRPIVASWVGNTLIRMEENPFPDKKLPFVLVSYLPVRKSAYGEPDGALLEDNQKILGAVTRGMIDIMAKSANGQTGVRKDALDVTNRRKFEKGDDYEFNPTVDPRQAFYMHTYPEIPASAQFMVQMNNMEAESLTGVKAFSQGITSGSLGDVAAGIRGVLDAASKRETAILRRLASGLVKIGRKLISMNAEFLSDTEVVRITDEEFVEVQRDDLAGEFDLKLGISTAEEDNAKAQELAFMLQTMGNNMDANMMKLILAEIARLRKMPDLAKMIEEHQPEPDPMAERQREAEVAKAEAEARLAAARATEAETQAMLNQAKIGTEQAKAQNLSSNTDRNNLDFVEQESGVKQERELQKQGAQAKAQAEMKVLESYLNPPKAAA